MRESEERKILQDEGFTPQQVNNIIKLRNKLQEKVRENNLTQQNRYEFIRWLIDHGYLQR